MVFGFISEVAKGVGGVAVGTVGAVGGAAGGLVVGTLSGKPLSGMADGASGGAKVGDSVGRQLVGAGAAVARVGVEASYDCVVKPVTVAGNGIVRAVEACGNGHFHKTATPYQKLCAFCSADVYRVRTDGPREYELTIGGTDYQITCLSKKSPTLRCALYLVDNPKGKGYVILAFRGTEAKIIDLVKDMHIVLGSLNTVVGSVYEDGNVARSIKQAYPGRHLMVTGHSLGGAQATIFTADEKNYHHIYSTEVFNPGTGLFQNDCDSTNLVDWLRDFPLTRSLTKFGSRSTDGVNGSTTKVVVHHIWGDVISALTTGSDIMTVHTYDLGHTRDLGFLGECPAPHSMGNFLTRDMEWMISESGQGKVISKHDN